MSVDVASTTCATDVRWETDMKLADTLMLAMFYAIGTLSTLYLAVELVRYLTN